MHARPTARALPWVLGLLLALLQACTPTEYAEAADAEVAEILTRYQARTLGSRVDWVEQPAPAREDGPAFEAGMPAADPDLAAPLPARLDDDPYEPSPQGGETLEQAPDAGGGDGVSAGAEDADRGSETLALGLEEALLIGFRTAREIATRREQIYQQTLDLTGARFDFGPQLAATLAYVFNNAERESGTPRNPTSPSSDERNSNIDADFSLSQILATGGSVGFDAAYGNFRRSGPDRVRIPGVDDMGNPITTVLRDPTNGRVQETAVFLNLNQPLLRGAGYEVSHEPLTQARRDLIYEVRAFELFRQSFSIDIAEDFFDLVRRTIQLENERQNYQESLFDREKTDALRQLDRNRDEDVFLARRRVIDAENRLLVAEANFDLALDSFRIRLGLPDSIELDVSPTEPPFSPVRLDPGSAVSVALRNRLDLITEQERIEDRERAVRNARNGLLPDLDLDMAYGYRGLSDDGDFDGPDRWEFQSAVSAEIPLQRTPERNIYRSAMIGLTRARRDLELLQETIDRDVRNSLRQLERIEDQIVLQQVQIEQERRAVAITEIRYENGDAENRDLLDARQTLVNAQNDLIDLKVDHFIAALRLKRDLGILFVDETGIWSS